MYLLEISFLSFNRINLLINRLKNLTAKIDYFGLNEYICITIFDNNSEGKEIKKLKRFLNSVSKEIQIDFFENFTNVGFPANLKKSIENSKGFYKWLFSDDDYLNMFFLQSIVELLKEKNVDFVSLKTIAIKNPPIQKKYNLDKNYFYRFHKPNINNFINNKNFLDIDKNLGFISSNIIKTSFLKEALVEITTKYNYLLDNNYLIKAINYNVLSKVNLLAMINDFPIVFQNIKEGSYFYNDPLLRRKTFIFDSTEIYLYIKKLNNINFNYKSKKFIEKKLYLNFSLWLSLKKDKNLKLTDILYIYKHTLRIYPSILIFYLIPIFILNKLRDLRKFNSLIV